jgi:hypothetical protein
MNQAINYLSQAFPDQDVVLRARPDGTFVLSLNQGGETSTKVIASDVIYSEQKLQKVVRDIHRDTQLACGELKWKGATAHWVWLQLPTYSGDFHVTKAKRLSQRPLAHMRPSRINSTLTA